MKNYTEEEKQYILSKITDMQWYLISDRIKLFWIDWRNRNELKSVS